MNYDLWMRKEIVFALCVVAFIDGLIVGVVAGMFIFAAVI